jgi:CheY-like chemotaxis protein
MDTVTMTDRHLRTVVVDHSPDFIRAVCEQIQNEPGLIVVATAESGFAALIAVDVLRPDLVLMGLAMPGMDGLEATRRIKARAEPPLVVLMTLHDPASMVRMARYGQADAIISKRELGQSAACILRALGGR